jgi:hypothetical protein
VYSKPLLINLIIKLNPTHQKCVHPITPLLAGIFVIPSAWNLDGPLLVVDEGSADGMQSQFIEMHQKGIRLLDRTGESHFADNA